MDKQTALLIIIAILGSFLIGKGITGFAIISQTCCFSGENCNPENMCEVVKPELKNPFAVNSLSVISGTIIVILALAAVHKHLHEKHVK